MGGCLTLCRVSLGVHRQQVTWRVSQWTNRPGIVRSTPDGISILMVLDIGIFFPGAHHPTCRGHAHPSMASASELRISTRIPWHYSMAPTPCSVLSFPTFSLLCSTLFFHFSSYGLPYFPFLSSPLLSPPPSFPLSHSLFLLEPREAGHCLLPPHALACVSTSHFLPWVSLRLCLTLSSSCSPVSLLPKYSSLLS